MSHVPQHSGSCFLRPRLRGASLWMQLVLEGRTVSTPVWGTPAAHRGNKENRVGGHLKCCSLEVLCVAHVGAGPVRQSRSMSASEGWTPAQQVIVHSSPREARAVRRGRRWSRRAGRAGVGSMGQVTKGQRWPRCALAPGCLQQQWGQPPSLPAELAPGSALQGCRG